MPRAVACLVAILLLGPDFCAGPGQGDIKQLKLRDWQPRSMLITKATEVTKPAFPVIDVHNHLGGGKTTLTPERVQHYVAEMDAAGVRTVVNLDGGWGRAAQGNARGTRQAHPGRFLTYALIDFRASMTRAGRIARRRGSTRASKRGPRDLKFHKSLGLGVRYKDGRFMPVDDPKLDPIWEVCAATSGRSRSTRVIPAPSSPRSTGSASDGTNSTSIPSGCSTAKTSPSGPTCMPSASA